MIKMINKLSKWLIKKYIGNGIKKGHLNKKGIRYSRELGALNPGKEIKGVIENYYIQKVTYILLIIIVAVVVGILSLISQRQAEKIVQGNKLIRNEAGNGDYNVGINAKAGEYDYGKVDIKVDERMLTKEEYDSMIADVLENIESNILGENRGLDYVDSELKLIEAVDGYPCSIRWETSDYMLLHNDGNFGDIEAYEDGNDIMVRAIISYKSLDYIKEYPIRIFPHKRTIDQEKASGLMSAIESANSETKALGYMILPTSVEGNQLTWKEAKEPVAIYVLLGMFGVIIAMWLGMDRDLIKQYENRNRKLLIEYSEIVSKMQLLLSSGLTIRGTIERMTADYKKSIKKGGKEKYVYEELLLCVRKMQDGMSEAACYEYFGNRCGLTEYRKLASILVQNLKKGNEGIMSALVFEGKNAFDERKAVAKRMGEEAQTKLLFPMVIMLSVVMVIIIIPAYMSFAM